MATYHVIACDVLREELLHFGATTGHVYTHHFLPQGLHNEPERLRASVAEAVLSPPQGTDAVLIGYGLCSNGLHGVRAMDVPLVVPRAHDCITLFLGSRERYQTYFTDHPGTYWYTPGWIEVGAAPSRERVEQRRAEYAEAYGEENADYLLEMMDTSWTKHYSNAAYVDLGVGCRDSCVAFTRECAGYFGWTCDVLEGDPRLLVMLLSGNWSEEDFLVVPPGAVIVVTHDGRLVDAAR